MRKESRLNRVLVQAAAAVCESLEPRWLLSGVTFNVTNYPLQSTPSLLSVGDFNDTGVPDLVAVGAPTKTGAGSELYVAFSNNNGSFTQKPAFAAPTLVSAIATGDINGDGKTDLVTADSSTGALGLFISNGDGTFRYSALGIAANQPDSIAVADFNGDGNADLAVADAGTDSVLVFFGNGDGTFRPPVAYNVGAFTTDVQAADFNRDGMPDLAVSGASGIAILLNNGDGTFSPVSQIATANGTEDFGIADFNHDGTPDIAQITASQLNVIFGNGDGTFQSPEQIASYTTSSNYTVQEIVPMDITGDGNIDLVTEVSDNTKNYLRFRAGYGNGLFAPAYQGTSYQPHPLVTADFNGDGIPDLATIAGGYSGAPTNRIAVVINTTTPTLTTLPAPALGAPAAGATASALPTFNWSPVTAATQYRLIVATNSADLPTNPTATTGGASVVLNATTSGTSFTPSAALSLGTTYYWEVIATRTGKGATWSAINHFTTTTQATLPAPTPISPVQGALASSVTIFNWSPVQGALEYRLIVATNLSDLPTDPAATTGGASVVLDVTTTSNSYDSTISLAAPGTYYWEVIGFNASQTGAWSAAAQFNDYRAASFQMTTGNASNSPGNLVVADFNGDHIPDLLETNSYNGVMRATIQFGNGDGTFKPPVQIGTVPRDYFPVVGDLNGDGKPDIVIGGSVFTILLNNGDGTFKSSTIAVAAGMNPSFIADVNGDGKGDLFAVNPEQEELFLLLGNGDGTFSSPTLIANDNQHVAAVGDFDGDGKPDLLLNNGQALTILHGNGDGTFRLESNLSISLATPTIADVNGDGIPDIVTVFVNGSTLASLEVLLGNGNGTFRTQTLYTLPVVYGFVDVVGDFNGDGIPDIAITVENLSHPKGSNILLFFGNGDGTFRAPQRINDSYAGFTAIAAGDINGDHRTDLVTTGQSYLSGYTTVFLNNTPTPAALAAPTPIAPAAKATGLPFKPTFSWSAVSGATEYRILVAAKKDDLPTDPDATVAGPSMAIDEVTASTTFTPSVALANGTNYFWEVIAYGSDLAGTWSAISRFTTEPPVPAPVPAQPANGSDGISTLPVFGWSAVSGATKYRLILATNPADLPTDPAATVGGASVVFDVVSNTNQFTDTTTLTVGTAYYWEVIGYNPNLHGLWSTVSTFIPGLPPPTPLGPLSSATPSTLPTFSWTSVAGATGYRLIVATDSGSLPTDPTKTTGGAGVVIDELAPTTSFTPIEALSANTQYFWEVIAVSAGAAGYMVNYHEFYDTCGGTVARRRILAAQLAQAYGFNQLTFGSTAANGAGQTIAIVDAYNDPKIRADLRAFDAFYDLPGPPNFTVVNETGAVISPANLPAAPKDDSSWISEADLDIEWAHALAPGANILLVEATDSVYFAPAIRTARSYPGVTVVSMSFGGNVFNNGSANLFTTPAGHPGVTFIAASGDYGQFAAVDTNGTIGPGKTPGVDIPAGFGDVLAAGGTSLSISDSNGSWLGEELWSDASTDGAGFGLATGIAEPSYQVPLGSASARQVPDVSFDSDPNTGVAVYDSSLNGNNPWSELAGTSLSAPAWAAIIAIANQGRALAALPSLDGAQNTLPMLYEAPVDDFHETGAAHYTSGTGLGTPIVNKLVPDLIAPPASIVGGMLSVLGSSGSDTISLTTDGTFVFVNLNSTQSQFELSEVKSISVSGGAGGDLISVGSGLIGATLNGGDGPDTLSGGDGNDSLNGGKGADNLAGGLGNDTLFGAANNDTLDGGAGNDSISGGSGEDSITGDAGNDTIFAGLAGGVESGGAGNDLFFTSNSAHDTIFGGAGNDTATIDGGILDVIPNHDVEDVL